MKVKGPKSSHNFERVVDYLIPLSVLDASVLKKRDDIKDEIVKQWEITSSDFQDDVITCPCGVWIHERCYIRNRINGNETFVGNVCIKNFSEDVKSVAIIARALRKGVSATISGHHCCGKAHYHATLTTRASGVYKMNQTIVAYFGSSPLNEDTKDIKIDLDEFSPTDRLFAGQKYTIHMKLVRPANGDPLQYVLTKISLYSELPYNHESYIVKIRSGQNQTIFLSNGNVELAAQIKAAEKNLISAYKYNVATKTWTITTEMDMAAFRLWIIDKQERLNQKIYFGDDTVPEPLVKRQRT